MNLLEQADLLVSMFAMVGTVAAAIFAAISSIKANRSILLTEKQIKQNKENFIKQSRPVLHLTSLEEEYATPFQQRSFESYSNKIGFYSKHSNYLLMEIVNLGGSSARNILVETKVENFDEVFSSFNQGILGKYKDVFGYEITKEMVPHSEDEVYEGILYRYKSGAGNYDNKPLSEFIDYLTPLADNIKKIHLPSLYITLYELMIYHALSGTPFVTPIKLEVKIEYQDFIGNKWRQKFSLESRINNVIYIPNKYQVQTQIMPMETENIEL